MEAAAAAKEAKRLRFRKTVEADGTGLRSFHVSVRNPHFKKEISDWQRRHKHQTMPSVFLAHFRLCGLVERETGKIAVRPLPVRLLVPGAFSKTKR